MAYFSLKILATVAQLPLPVREFKENIILLGLWHSLKNSPVNILLDNIVHNMKKFQRIGILLELEVSIFFHICFKGKQFSGSLYPTKSHSMR